ncbi:hypothetical protein GALL_551230 [mine drainage metagenome]|uniref:Uncharacterized protein n=1 Tax=mine drainage metagenome TaxID=410659 RepID=A0A1J5NYN2_9ZZZZ
MPGMPGTMLRCAVAPGSALSAGLASAVTLMLTTAGPLRSVIWEKSGKTTPATPATGATLARADGAAWA